MAKKYTVLVIPEGTNNVRNFSIPIWSIPAVMIVMIFSITLCVYWYYQYGKLHSEVPDRLAMEKDLQRQESQIEDIAQRLTSYKKQMGKIQIFNRRLRIMANLEKPNDINDGILGVGGHSGSDTGPGVRLSQSAQDRQLMNIRRDLDALRIATEDERGIQEELAKFLQERRSIMAATPSIWPVRGWVTSNFGYRISPFTGKRDFHAGLDIASRQGTPIKATADGVVTFVGRNGGYGKMVTVNHGHGMVTRYAHLSKYKTKKGQKVKRGHVIGLLGNSGRSTGPHLHYEVLISGTSTNPKHYILD